MEKVWRTLFIAAVALLVLASSGLGYLWQSTSAELSDTKATLGVTQAELVVTSDNLATAQSSLLSSQDSLRVAETELAQTRDELNSSQNLLSATQDKLGVAQDDLASKTAQLAHIQSRYPPKRFTNLSQLQAWVNNNHTNFTADPSTSYSDALRVQEWAARDGFLISVDVGTNGWPIMCAVIGRTLYIWYPEQTDIIKAYDY